MADRTWPWISYQCRCCGVVVQDHSKRRVLKAIEVRECLQELCGMQIGSRVLMVDDKMAKIGLKEPYACKSCYSELEKIVNVKNKLQKIETGERQNKGILSGFLCRTAVP